MNAPNLNLEELNRRPLLRTGWDHDPVAPWVWGDMLGRVVQVVSYAIPAPGSGATIDRNATLMVRMIPGDPTTLHEVPLRQVACFEQSRHEWDQRPMFVYDEGTHAFYFTDDGRHGHPVLAPETNRNYRRPRRSAHVPGRPIDGVR